MEKKGWQQNKEKANKKPYAAATREAGNQGIADEVIARMERNILKLTGNRHNACCEPPHWKKCLKSCQIMRVTCLKQ
ncbi:MAG: hypothetical protein FWG10_06685 [Eubacteriaceae bacterium]|nr:hypothetical protein [Eubacteriaceae bacterium]